MCALVTGVQTCALPIYWRTTRCLRPAEGIEWYANAGRGYETPSASELAYRADGASGLNIELRPARSRSQELGVRVHRGDPAWALAAFNSRTEDALVVAARRSEASRGGKEGVSKWTYRGSPLP